MHRPLRVGKWECAANVSVSAKVLSPPFSQFPCHLSQLEIFKAKQRRKHLFKHGQLSGAKIPPREGGTHNKTSMSALETPVRAELDESTFFRTLTERLFDTFLT